MPQLRRSSFQSRRSSRSLSSQRSNRSRRRGGGGGAARRASFGRNSGGAGADLDDDDLGFGLDDDPLEASFYDYQVNPAPFIPSFEFFNDGMGAEEYSGRSGRSGSRSRLSNNGEEQSGSGFRRNSILSGRFRSSTGGGRGGGNGEYIDDEFDRSRHSLGGSAWSSQGDLGGGAGQYGGGRGGPSSVSSRDMGGAGGAVHRGSHNSYTSDYPQGSTASSSVASNDPSRLYEICEMALPKGDDNPHHQQHQHHQRSRDQSHHSHQHLNGGSGRGERGEDGMNNNNSDQNGEGDDNNNNNNNNSTHPPTQSKPPPPSSHNPTNHPLQETWDAIRHWLSKNRNPDDRHAAATRLGMFSTTALHIVCKLPNPPVDIIRSLVDCSPETVTWADSSGWLPLHHACANGADWNVLDVLVEAYPESRAARDRRSRTPLHFAFFRADVRSADGAASNQNNSNLFSKNEDDEAGEAVVDVMRDVVALLSDSGAAELHDENGMLPIHYACAYGTGTSVLEVLVQRYPASVSIRENRGRTPLHLAMVNAHRSASPRVVEFLLHSIEEWTNNNIGGSLNNGGSAEAALPTTMTMSDVVNATDREGNLPVHLLASISARLKPEQKDQQRSASNCLVAYLNAEPRPTADFLTAVQSLPEWLRDSAVVHPHVQEILNKKIAKRFPTSIMMLDGYVLLMLICCFEIASMDHIDRRFGPNNQEEFSSTSSTTGSFFGNVKFLTTEGTLTTLLLGATYFLLREIIQIVALLNLGTFRYWLTDTTNWLDCILIGLVFYNTLAMMDNDGSSIISSSANDITSDSIVNTTDDSFRISAAFTKGVLWYSFINFIKSTIVDFAVFVGGVYYVVRRLAAFLVALIVILLAFAQMFWMVFLSSDICKNFDDEEILHRRNPHCRFNLSFLKVYSSLMGEVQPDLYDTSVAQFLYVSYAFLVVIILTNVLIAIVTDSYGIIKNERAAMVFWSNRLDFVAEMDAIMTVRNRVSEMVGWSFASYDDYRDTDTDNRRRGGGGPGGWVGGGSNAGIGDMSNVVITAGRNDGMIRGNSGLMSYGTTSNPTGTGPGRDIFRDGWENLKSLFGLSLASEYDVNFGSLEFWFTYAFRFFAIFIIVPLWILAGLATAGWLWPPQVREWLFVQRKTNITRADLANQVMKEVKSLKADIRGLKLDLKSEMKLDRKEIETTKIEVEAVKRDVVNDLLQVKEIMNSLLEMGKATAKAREERATINAIADAQCT